MDDRYIKHNNYILLMGPPKSGKSRLIDDLSGCVVDNHVYSETLTPNVISIPHLKSGLCIALVELPGDRSLWISSCEEIFDNSLGIIMTCGDLDNDDDIKYYKDSVEILKKCDYKNKHVVLPVNCLECFTLIFDDILDYRK